MAANFRFFTGLWRRRRVRKWLIRAGLAVAIYLLAGFFLVPALVKWQLLKQLPPLTHRRAAVRQVKFNPLALSLTVRGLGLTETNGEPFASFDEFYANFQLSTLFRLAWTFDEIHLTEPRARVVRGADGAFNFANLAISSTNTPPTKPKARGAWPRLLVFNLGVTNGHFAFTDLSRKTPFRTIYEPIDLTLRNFSTKPRRESPYSFEALSDTGRGVVWSGEVSAQPLGSSGMFRISGLLLPPHSPYLEEYTRAQLTAGTLDLSANYSFSLSSNRTDASASNLAVTITGLEFKDPESGEMVLRLPSWELRDGTFDLASQRIRVGSIVIKEPEALVRRRADGSINLPSLVLKRATTRVGQAPARLAPTNAPSRIPWVFELADYQLTGGAVRFEDATVPGRFRSLFKPVDLRLQHFSTASNTTVAVRADLAAEAAETVNLVSEYSLEPRRGTAALKLSGLDLKKYQPYLARWLRGTLAGGKVDLALEVSQDTRGDRFETSLTNTSVRVSKLSLQAPEATNSVVDVASFAVENAAGSLAEKAIRIGAIKSAGVTIHAAREPDGTIDLLKLLPPRTNSVANSNSPPASTPASSSPPSGSSPAAWQVALEEVELGDWALHFLDRQLPNPAKLDLDQMALKLRGAQFPSNAPVAAEFSTRVNGAGTIAAQGKVWPYSPGADAGIQIAGLNLRDFQPWLEQQVKLGIESGTIGSTGRVEFATPASARNFRFTGNLGIADFATVDQVLFQELVRWDHLGVEGIDVSWPPNSVAAERVLVSGLKAGVLISSNKLVNLQLVLAKPPTNAPPSSPKPPAGDSVNAGTASAPAAAPHESVPIRLGEFRLDGAAIHFADHSVQPPCVVELRQLSGTVKGISSKPDSTADVDISGQVDEGAPFALRGKINPLANELALDLALTNHNLQLAPFTPYMEKYVGHPLNKGRLSLDLAYAVHARQLKAQNKIEIDQLMLGPRNDNPEASKLPVKLAVALLKNSDGRIDLDIPLNGRLDDPQFKIGPIILKVIGNLIVKAAASPFKLIGSLVGGGEELSFVEFDYGQAQLLGAETNKLNKLVQALEKRPALNLEIEGAVDPVADRDALARARVRADLKSRRLRELSQMGQAPPSADQFQLAPLDYERLLRAAVVAAFGTNLTEAIRAAAARVSASTNAAPVRPPDQGPGLFQRAAALFKPKNERVAVAEAHRASKADARVREQNPELAKLSAGEMEMLLASKTEVPADQLHGLMEGRAKAVQAYLLGKVKAERIFLVAPKAIGPAYKGAARVNLSLN